MTAVGNIFACLVHENVECVIDLVRNLRIMDPASLVLLYNGGHDRSLLRSGFPFERYGAVVLPDPQPVAWGRLHPFALTCMEFARNNFDYRTLTIVDSDQLAVRPGYSAFLQSFLQGRKRVGMLGNCSSSQPQCTRVPPAQAAHQEKRLWLPFLRRFPDGESKFVHWSFWPSTVFTAEAANELVNLFASDAMLHDVMASTKIWATEEVILPTLLALLGFEIHHNPCSYQFVQYRQRFSAAQLKTAVTRKDIFWVHPVPRVYDDPLRTFIRSKTENVTSNEERAMPIPTTPPSAGLLLHVPILTRMKQIDGWLAEDEADLLIGAASLALTKLPSPHSIVEVGSYCGRSTVVLGSVVKSLRPDAKVHAIDPHDGKVGAVGQGIQVMAPTLDKLKYNLASAGLTDYVHIIPQRSWEVPWNQPISFLFIDGLHDYANVARDFFHFEPWLAPEAYIAFHDYADYYRGVQTFVDELLRMGRYEKVHLASSMLLIRKVAEAVTVVSANGSSTAQIHETTLVATDSSAPNVLAGSPAPLEPASVHAESSSDPLVSCIMPTANRPHLVPQAIAYFLRQTYANRELLILDDGSESVADLIPADPRIRYLRMSEKKSMGTKHNLACEMARGEIIAHWDDDDWMSDNRLSYQVGELLSRPPNSLVGLSRLIYYDPRKNSSWEYVYPPGQRAWVCGNTFCYRKPVWQRNPFPSRNEGADTVWVWGLKDAAISAHPDHSFYISIIHTKNTSPKRTNQPRWIPYSADHVRNLMQNDFSFYATVAGCL
jgi:Methyltransferase domain/Glycosyl transferase family 2